MMDEDRTRALDLYGEIFDDVGNDTAVLQLLVSPTRQAVNLARAYDAKSRGPEAGGQPAYLAVIEEIRQQADSLYPAVPRINDDQLSLFNEPERTERPVENIYESFGFEFPDDEELDAASDALPEELPDSLDRFPDEDRDDVPPPASPVPAPAAPAEPVREKTPEEELDDFADSVAAFLADFGGAEEDAPSAEAPAPVQETPKPPVSAEAPVWTLPVEQKNAPVKPNVPEMKETVPIVGLLVLMIVLAIPLGLLCIGLLLIPVALCLGLAVFCLSVGFYGFIIAFTAFSVFADILLVFGLSLALVAFGLLAFWVLIWLLACVIPSLIRWICRFIREHGYKEVEV